MVKIPFLILAVIMWSQCKACAAYVVPGNTTPDDERYFDKEVRIYFNPNWKEIVLRLYITVRYLYIHLTVVMKYLHAVEIW